MTTPGGGQPVLPGSGAEDTKNIAGELAGWMKNPAGGILAAAFNILSTIFGKGSTGIEGIKAWVDGQTALNQRTDLLSPLLDYGSCYMADKFNFNGSNAAVCFSNQIGPMRGCHISTGRIILEDKGLWDIRCQLKYDISLLNGICGLEVRILRPDNSIYSVQEGLNYATGQATITVVTSVVVPDPGYKVQVVVVRTTSGRGIEGGPKANRLTVQHLSRDTTTGNTGQG